MVEYLIILGLFIITLIIGYAIGYGARVDEEEEGRRENEI